MTKARQHSNLDSALCIINPSAAKRKWLRRKRLHDYLIMRLPGQKYDMFGEKESTIDLVRRLCPRHDVIVAVGGDGTVADVLQGIRLAQRERETVFGIIPLGSGNAFRQALGIPKNFREALSVLRTGQLREVRMMEIEEKIAGFSSIGATALVTQVKLERSIEGFWGHVLAGRRLFSVRKWDVVAELEDGIDDQGRAFLRKTMRTSILDCIVAKSKYFGYGWKVAPQASLADDYLDITFYEMNSLLYILSLPLLYFGIGQRKLPHYKAKRLVLRGQGLPLQYHGEILEPRDRVEARVMPGVIKVICPSQEA